MPPPRTRAAGGPQKTKKLRIAKLGACIRRASATARLKRAMLPNSPSFRPELLTREMSGKFAALVEKLRELDTQDLREHGKKFKHFIFTDLRDGLYGAKALAAFLIKAGYEFRLRNAPKTRKYKGKIVETKKGEVVLSEAPADPIGSQGFAILQSNPLWNNPTSVSLKKQIISVFNSRPGNVHGENLRILVLDSKYKEGIDLFDVKYVHLMEPAIAESDLKQAIGRATRFCGQRGLEFIPKRGWPLQVYIYNAEIPNRAPFKYQEGQKVDAHELMLRHSGLDLALLNFVKEITVLSILSAIDYDLNYKINNFKIESEIMNGDMEELFPHPNAEEIRGHTETLAMLADEPFDVFQNGIAELYKRYKWTSPVVKNGCESSAVVAPGTAVTFTKTQDFIRHYLTPKSPFKGLLAWHSVGTGKTCMAVAAATSFFEKEGYSILWVTRNSLMSDVFKNVFGAVCSIPIQEKLAEGVKLPDGAAADGIRRRMLSKAWFNPISYRTFQNALQKKNQLGRLMYARNADPLHKTFLIIDEIHKLQDGDLAASEAADFKIVQEYIWNSYKFSGRDSVRPLLMTATPISDSPNALFEILNTLIPSAEDRLPTADEFRAKFTTEGGEVTAEGRRFYQRRVKGLISYLNREYDPTTFAQPVIHTIPVPIGDSAPPALDTLVTECIGSAPSGAGVECAEARTAVESAEAAVSHAGRGAVREAKKALTAARKTVRKACSAAAVRKTFTAEFWPSVRACYDSAKKDFASRKATQMRNLEACFPKSERPRAAKFPKVADMRTAALKQFIGAAAEAEENGGDSVGAVINE